MYAREVYRIVTAENILAAQRSSEKAKNIAQWAQNNPVLKRILDEARELAKELTDDA